MISHSNQLIVGDKLDDWAGTGLALITNLFLALNMALQFDHIPMISSLSYTPQLFWTSTLLRFHPLMYLYSGLCFLLLKKMLKFQIENLFNPLISCHQINTTISHFWPMKMGKMFPLTIQGQNLHIFCGLYSLLYV